MWLNPSPLLIIGIVCIFLAVIIIRVQLRAKYCDKHTAIAGILAWLVAIICLFSGGYLIQLAII